MPEASSAPEQTIINTPNAPLQADQAAIQRKENRAIRHDAIHSAVTDKASSIIAKYPNADQSLVIDQARSRVATEIRIERLKQEVERNKGRAIRDTLTGALNGTGFEEIMQLQGRRTLRSNKPMTIVVLDANNLRQLNKDGGHAAGDAYLKGIAEVLTRTSRASDILGRNRNSDEANQDQSRVARWGGDEFGVILEETDIEGAKVWWERTANEFAAAGISIGAGLQVLNPEDIRGKTPGEISATIADKKHEADMAMMGVAKEASKLQNKPVLAVYNELPQETRDSLPQRMEELKKVA